MNFWCFLFTPELVIIIITIFIVIIIIIIISIIVNMLRSPLFNNQIEIHRPRLKYKEDLSKAPPKESGTFLVMMMMMILVMVMLMVMVIIIIIMLMRMKIDDDDVAFSKILTMH